jgi:eukaryotic-like serine/threonine-protein kinase
MPPHQAIDGKYFNLGMCSDAGGMGTTIFVAPIFEPAARYVLKYCKLQDEEAVARFKREVKVMQNFNGSEFVVPILDANLDHDPPYFVMPLFEGGDLTKLALSIQASPEFAEDCFSRMITCIATLHAEGTFHRDIKPSNFLHNERGVVVSDLGLCTDTNSTTRLTSTTQQWGTEGYMPPEYANGAFKNATSAGDIFMLGKSFFALLTGRSPVHFFHDDKIPAPLFAVLERACHPIPERRYQTLAQLRQSLVTAFNLILGRVSGSKGVLAALQAIVDRWQGMRQQDPNEVTDFINELMVLGDRDQQRVCFDLRIPLFEALALPPLQEGQMNTFLNIYGKMAHEAEYGFSFAEVIASNMEIIFRSPYANDNQREQALRIAIDAAVRQNRFAAMDTCAAMIASVSSPGLALRVHDLIIEIDAHFMSNIDVLKCQSPAVKAAVEQVKAKLEAKYSANPNPFGF